MTSPLVGIACGLLLKGQNIANIVEGEPTTKEEFESYKVFIKRTLKKNV